MRKNESIREKSREIEENDTRDDYKLLCCLFFSDSLNSRPVKFNLKFRPSLTAQERLALLLTAGIFILGLLVRYWPFQ